jgi:hypothetical protein
LLEGGVSPELLQGQFEAVKKLEGNNVAAQIERFMSMFGLNYTGGVQVWDMANSGRTDWNEMARVIKDVIKPEYASDSQTLQDILNDLRTNGIKAGKFEFDNTEIKLLREQAQILADILRGKQAGPQYPSLSMSEVPSITEPIDMHPVLAEIAQNNPSRLSWKFWQDNPNSSLPTRYFLENDQAARAFIDDTSENMGRPVNEIIDYIIGGRNPTRFDSYFQGRLDTAQVGHETGVIDVIEYGQTMKDLVDSLRAFGASADRLTGINERLVNDGIPIHGTIEATEY